jgi:endonuclease/exonuclease/phosphatase family metal-dependent hydrolase
MKKILIGLITLSFYCNLSAQDETLKVLSYNLLNYPNPEIPVDYRADTLKKIIDYYTPDLFLMQELKSSSGFSLILNNVFNTDGVDYYNKGTWEPQHSNPGSSWRLQQNVIYNTQKLSLSYETFLYTDVRDLNVFKFYFKDPNLAIHQDTTYLYVVTMHLKSSQGADNEALRLSMVEILENFLDTIPADANVIVGADYNLYTSDEAAYQLLLNNSNNVILADPISTPGTWHSNNNFRFVHTQSTRTVPINGDGAGGGMDDRFDLIVVSENLMDPNNRIFTIEDTYEPMGNNGNCFNARIIDCEDNDVPANVINALYQMSDHLPVKMELGIDYPAANSINELQYNYAVKIINQNSERLLFSIDGYGKSIKFNLIDVSGKILLNGSSNASNLATVLLSSLSHGIYFLIFQDSSIEPYKFVKH